MKDLIASDIKRVFLNTAEFSDVHNVNGTKMPIQIDSNEQIERRTRNEGLGTYRNEKLLFVSADDFGAMPRQGSLLILDGKTYTVSDAIDEGGVYSITIEANRGR